MTNEELERIRKHVNDLLELEPVIYPTMLRHANNLIGEIERLQHEVSRVKDLWYLDAEKKRNYRKVLGWVKQRHEEEWTYEGGTGEVVEEIIQKFDCIE